MSLNAPALARYEIANALTKKAAAASLIDEAMREAWKVLDELPIAYHELRFRSKHYGARGGNDSRMNAATSSAESSNACRVLSSWSNISCLSQ